MTDLFDSTVHTHEPLASRMRPRTLDEYIGQDHIVGKGRLLRRAIAADQLTSVIFYGPPGSGKTTLARVIANHTSSSFITLNAVLTGVADIRKAIQNAEEQRKLYNRKTILFVDEVHRWNKSQQDALLPWVENGTIILIGATTENPFFEVNKALVSRSRVFQLKGLTRDDLMKTALQALNDEVRGYGHWKVEFEKGALEHLVDTANGDARSLLNALELAVETTPTRWAPDETPPVPNYGSTIYINKETCEESIQKKVVLYDKDGDYHYDIISAFIKSLRGRDPDAACYWLARMVKAGEDPDFIFRRMLISACEDTGLADPYAVQVVQSCAAAFDRVGLPEGRYFLAHAALYLSTAPKSNSSMAFFDALAAVENEDAEVPNHLKDNNRDAEGFGHGAGYLYPHAYRDHWVAQQYLPSGLVGKVFYTPTTQGYENKIRNDVLSRRELQISALLEESKKTDEDQIAFEDKWWKQTGHQNGLDKTEENLTFTPPNKTKESVLQKADQSWKNRLDSNKAEILLQIRDTMVLCAELLRHHRSLIWNADDALLIFDITRKTPEGLTAGICRTSKGMELLTQYSKTLDILDKPQLTLLPPGFSLTNTSFRNILGNFGDICFDRIFFRDIFAIKQDIISFIDNIKSLYTADSNERNFSFDETQGKVFNKTRYLSENSKIIISQRIPCKGQRISSLISEQIFSGKKIDEDMSALLNKMSIAEREFFADENNPLFNWDQLYLIDTLSESGFLVQSKEVILTEKRRITIQDIDKWFDYQNSSYGQAIEKAIGQENITKIVTLLKNECSKQLFTWKTTNIFITCDFRNSGVHCI